uniref:Uncharacterized protein n=1 Tax=Glaesserella parasuis TaxID=738 RepID=T1RQ73_GLAPU|nr:hypothetical protein [Glaesserella parasuis]
MVMPQTIVQLAPNVAPFFTIVSRYSLLRSMRERGLYTLVKTILGPQNTPSSKCTLSYTDTLFWILHLSPIVTLFPINTFCPSDTPLPIFAPAQTCAKCQTLEPSPISAPSSTIALE